MTTIIGSSYRPRAARHLSLAAVVLATRLDATICAQLPPCASVGPGSILFLGRLLHGSAEAVPVPLKNGETRLSYRVRVLESFAGLPSGTRDVSVLMGYVRAGQEVLVDAVRREGHLALATCGNTGKATEPRVAQALKFLRQSHRSRSPGALSVRVYDLKSGQSLDGALVSLDGPTRRELLTKEGRADFSELPKGDYRYTASKSSFESPSSATHITIISSGCALADILLRPLR